MRLFTLKNFLALALVCFAGGAYAQDMPAPTEPVPHITFHAMETGQAAHNAFAPAKAAYDALVQAIADDAAADVALSAAVESGAADLADVAQRAADAHAALAQANADFNQKSGVYSDAVAAYDAAIAALTTEEPVEVFDPSEIMGLIEALRAELDAEKAANAAFRAAVCHGHDYDHHHADDYTEVCAQATPAAGGLADAMADDS